MEEIGEKLNGNSQIQNKTEFQNLPKHSTKFRSLYLQICWDLDKTSNIKVVALVLIYMFDFGKNQSLVQLLREKSTCYSAKYINLTETLSFSLNLDFQTLFPLDPLSFKPNSLHELFSLIYPLQPSCLHLHELCSLIYPLQPSCLQKLEYGSRFERIFELKIDKTETLN